MDIQKHIRELLAEQDCVVVPGLGGFITQYKPAVEDVNGKKIHPPSRSISFNRALNQNDGILIQHIACKASIPYKASEEKVEHYVDACKRQLSVRGIIILPEIGKLYNDNNGNLNFAPATGRNYLPEAFGLKAVSWFRTYNEIVLKQVVVEPVIETIQEEAPVLKPTPVRRKNRFRTGVGVSLAAAVVLVVLITQGVYIKPLQVNSLGIFTTSVALPETTEPAAHTITQVQLKSGTHPAPVMMPETDVTHTHDAVIEQGYYVVLGSFTDKEKAERYIKQQKLDNELLILDTGSAQFRVATYVTTNTSQAMASLNHFRSNFRKDVWLLYNSY